MTVQPNQKLVHMTSSMALCLRTAATAIGRGYSTMMSGSPSQGQTSKQWLNTNQQNSAQSTKATASATDQAMIRTMMATSFGGRPARTTERPQPLLR